MLSEALLENEREVVLSQKSRQDDESFLDVLIHLDDGSTVKMHSLVLAASSQLFQSIGQVRAVTMKAPKPCVLKHKSIHFGKFFSFYDLNYSDTHNKHNTQQNK